MYPYQFGGNWYRERTQTAVSSIFKLDNGLPGIQAATSFLCNVALSRTELVLAASCVRCIALVNIITFLELQNHTPRRNTHIIFLCSVKFVLPGPNGSDQRASVSKSE